MNQYYSLRLKDCIHSQKKLALLAQLPNLEEVSWVEEDPKNQGAWLYVYPYVKVLVADNNHSSYYGRIKGLLQLKAMEKFINLFKIKL